MIRKHRLGLRAVQANSRLEEKRDKGAESSLSVSIDSKKDKRKKMCLSGSVRLSWVGRVRPEMLCLHTRLPLFPKASRGLLYDDGRPPVGGLLHKAPAEEKLYPSE